MAGLTTVTTPVTGTPISSTTFGIPVANDITVLANPPTAKMRNSVGISIVNSTATALTWDTEDFDSVGGHSTVTNTSRYTVQTGYDGKYRLNTTVWWAANATSGRAVWFAVGGVDIPGSEAIVFPGTASTVSVNTEIIVALTAGQYVEVIVSQTSGGALATTTGGTTSRFQSWFEVQWVSQ